MKEQVSGTLIWTFLVGFLVVGIVGFFVIGFINGLMDDVEDAKPTIATPPSISVLDEEEVSRTTFSLEV